MKIFRNLIGLILGLAIGSIVNMSIVGFGHSLIPLPEGVTMIDIDEFELINFLTPFLAHAIGTLVGAIIAAAVAATAKTKLAIAVGIFFLIGGIAVSIKFTVPLWYIFVDLIICYIPMGILGGKIGTMINKK